MHDLLDIYLWLPRREGFMAFGPLDCRLQQVIYNKDDSSYYEYTLIYMEQVRFYFVTRISKTDNDRLLTRPGVATMSFAVNSQEEITN